MANYIPHKQSAATLKNVAKELHHLATRLDAAADRMIEEGVPEMAAPMYSTLTGSMDTFSNFTHQVEKSLRGEKHKRNDFSTTEIAELDRQIEGRLKRGRKASTKAPAKKKAKKGKPSSNDA